MSITRTPGASASARRLVITAVVGALVIIDQVTKYMITASFHLGESRNVIPGFFDITHVRNTGAAFGFLAGVDSVWVQRGFTAFTFFALAVIWTLYRSMRPEERLGRASFVMIGAGAIGNLIDRIQSGAVTDFLLFYIGEYQWPAFNVADSLITVGVAILAYTLVFHRPTPETAP